MYSVSACAHTQTLASVPRLNNKAQQGNHCCTIIALLGCTPATNPKEECYQQPEKYDYGPTRHALL